MDDLAVVGGGVFLPPGHWCEEQILKKFELQNPDYNMAMGMRGRGKFVPIPNQFINACHKIPFDHPSIQDAQHG